MATPVWVCGAECNLVVTGGAIPASHTRHFDAVSGGGNISIVTLGDGTKAFRFLHSGTAGAAYLQVKLNSQTKAVARFAITFNTLPSADTRLAAFIPAAGSFCALGFRASDAKLLGRFGTGAPVTSAVSVTTGVRYVVDILADVSSGTRSVSVQVTDSSTGITTDLGSQTTAVAASTIPSFRFGSSVSTETITGDIQYDDLVLTETDTDYPLGDGEVLAFSPARDGTHSVVSGHFKINNSTNITGAETTLFQNVDDSDLTSTTDRLTQNTTGTSEYLELRPPADIVETRTPQAVNVVAALRNESQTTANNISLKVLSGANTDNFINGASLASTAHIYFSKCYAAPPGGGAWSKSAIEALLFRYGFSSDPSPVPALHGLMLEVAYPAAAVTNSTGSGSPSTSLSASASGTAVQKFTGSGSPSKTLSKSASGSATQKFNASGSPARRLSASASGSATQKFTGSGSPTKTLAANAAGTATETFTGSGSPSKSLSDSASGSATQTFTGSGAPATSLSATASGLATNTPDAGEPPSSTGSGAVVTSLSASASGTATNDSPVVQRRGRGYRVLFDKEEPELGPHPDVVPQVADVIEVVDTPEIVQELPTFMPTQADARVASGITPPVARKAAVAPVVEDEYDDQAEELLQILMLL